MDLTLISDTHNIHRNLTLPPATDVIIHAGDFTNNGSLSAVEDFLDWYQGLPHRYKVLVGGNHDFLLEKQPELFQEILPSEIIYLEDEAVTIEGVHFWGSPITPYFGMLWAFNRIRGDKIDKHWKKIPPQTDVLITHGPPRGFGDRTFDGTLAGCSELLEKVKSFQPKLHVFGHIHEGYGSYEQENTTFINASVVDVNYNLINEPWTFEV